MALFSFILSFLLINTSSATEMVGALSAGQGGTGRAAVEATESVYLNPAGLALITGFYSNFAYQTGFTGLDSNRNTYSVTMTDGSKGLMFPGSLGFRRHSVQSANGASYKENEFKAGFGYRVTPRLSVGLGGTHLRADSYIGEDFNQSNVDAGVLIGLQPNWGLSFSGENLIKQSDNIPLALRRNARVAMGTQYVYQKSVTLRYETLMPLHLKNTQLLGHRAGLSIAMKSRFYLNGGYSVDDALGQNWGSVGVAWMGPRMKIAYSMQREERLGLGDRHLVDLWVDL